MTPEFKEWVERAKAVSVDAVLRQRNIKLKGGNSGRLAGPCPHCGGDDRFGVTLAKQAFHCRGCGKGGYGSISLVQFLDGSDFIHAVEQLTGQPPPKDKGSSKTKQRKPAEQLGPIRAIYEYRDETDILLFQVLRYSEPRKTFRQRRPDPHIEGAWIPNLDGVRLVPYKLLDLIEAISNDYVVYIVEGEKDVLTAIERLGVPATTNPMGIAKGWQASYNEFFAGADVVIIPDNDRDRSKGYAHAQNIARHLREVAARVRMLMLPESIKDLTEWAEAGGTVEQLHTLTERTPEYINGGAPHDPPPEPGAALTILSKAYFIMGFIPPDYLVDGMLQRRFIYSLTGQTGHAKTAVALLLARLVSSTAPNLRLGTHRVEHGRVVYFVGENPDDVRMRVIGMDSCRNDNPDQDNIWFIPGVFNIVEMFSVLEADMHKNGAASLVIVDTSAAYFLGNEELNNVQMGGHARSLRTLTTLPGGPTVLVLCHPIKHVVEPAQLLPRGGGAFLAEMDGNLSLWRTTDDTVELHHVGKYRGPDFQPISFKLEPIRNAKALVDAKGRQITTVQATPITQDQEASQVANAIDDQDRVLAAMLKFPDVSNAQLAKEIGWFQGDEPYRKKVERIIEKLARLKPRLTTSTRQGWVLTEQGKAQAREAGARYDRQKNHANQGKMEF